MEQNLFRPMYRKWPKPVNDISITSLKDPRQELSFVAMGDCASGTDKGLPLPGILRW